MPPRGTRANPDPPTREVSWAPNPADHAAFRRVELRRSGLAVVEEEVGASGPPEVPRDDDVPCRPPTRLRPQEADPAGAVGGVEFPVPGAPVVEQQVRVAAAAEVARDDAMPAIPP